MIKDGFLVLPVVRDQPRHSLQIDSPYIVRNLFIDYETFDDRPSDCTLHYDKSGPAEC